MTVTAHNGGPGPCLEGCVKFQDSLKKVTSEERIK